MAESFLYYNEFPEDVQRLVFEFAFEAVTETRLVGLVLHLLLVSKRIHQWVEPLLYRNLSTSRMHGSPFREKSSRPEDFFKNHVKSLSVDELGTDGFLEDILPECHLNLVGLAWWQIPHNRTKWVTPLLTQPYPSLRKLSFYYGIFPSDVEALFRKPIFQNLTHLDIGLPATDAHFMTGSSNANLRKVTSWKDLQLLESLIHLHLDMIRALSFRSTSVKEDFEEAISGVIPHLSETIRFFSLDLPYNFLSQASTLPAASRHFFDNLIRGSTDSRTLVCYTPSKRFNPISRKMTQAELISVEGFSEYLLPRRGVFRDDKRLRVEVPRPETDFWEEAERMILKRNRELYANKGRNGISKLNV